MIDDIFKEALYVWTYTVNLCHGSL